MAVAVALSFTAGVAVAEFTIGSFTHTFNQAGSQLAPSPPPGVSFTSAGSNLAALTSPSSWGACTSTHHSIWRAPLSLTSGGNVFVCLNSVSGGYPAFDTIYQVTINWSTSAPANTIYELSIYYGGATSNPVQAYVKTPASASFTSSATAMITFDMSSASVSSISSVDVIVSQCSGTTCP
ncbi:MAG: hypothetical protein QXG05_05660 [Nitrososphaerota archaeon]